ncbi:MAG: DNA translocase FtsK, partial [Alistipes sp.]|nr:DNA translocase FtsK [Alistipes sp.]
MSEILSGYIGSFGMVILLLVCWILIGVFINRDFIQTVNSAVDCSGRLVRNFRHIGHKPAPSYDDSFAADMSPQAPVRPQPVQPVPPTAGEYPPEETWISQPQEPVQPYRSEEIPYTIPPRSAVAADPTAYAADPVVPHVPAPAPVAPAPAVPVEDEDPFEEITRVVPGAEPVQPEVPAGPVIVAQDDEFIEFDLSNRQRLVMGRSGLVELDRPAVPQPVVDGPFEEITMAPKTPSKTPPQLPTEPQILEEPASPDEPYLMSVPRPAAPQPVQPAAPSARPALSAEEGVVVTVETHEARMVDERAIPTEAYDPLKDLVNYRKPPVTLLEDYVSDSEVSSEEIFENKSRIEETLKYFGIPIQRIKATVGPTVTLYEIVQAQGGK